MSYGSKRAQPPENPLVPHEKLRQIYTAMAQLRMLEEFCERSLRGKRATRLRIASMRAEEAVRASSILQLTELDLVSDCTDTVGMEYLLGARLKPLVRHIQSVAGSAKSRAELYFDDLAAGRRVVRSEDRSDQMPIAVGAASTLGSNGDARGVLLVFVHSEIVDSPGWKRSLKVAINNALPMVAVVLPGRIRGSEAPSVEISTRRAEFGLPIFPVDAADAIAMYRVLQECLIRARAGDGPALIDCIAFNPVSGSHNSVDPVSRMRGVLLEKGLATEAWLRRMEADFARRLDSTRTS